MKKDKDTIFLRLDNKLVASLKAFAAKSNLSINEYCGSILEGSIENDVNLESDEYSKLISLAKQEYQKNLQSIVLFGSYARGDETQDSDIDILIVLDKKVKITRSLYNKWDQLLPGLSHKLSIHIVNKPSTLNSLSGLWCEVALEGIVLYDYDFEVSRLFSSLRQKIMLGHYTYAFSHGHRYWIFQKEVA